MFKISNRQIIDVVKYDINSAILVEKMPALDGSSKYKVNYFVINFNTGEKENITKSAYQLSKFGNYYEQICNKINNYVDCDATQLNNKKILTIFSNGESGVFNNGELEWNGNFSYNDSPLCGLALDGDYFWSFCKKENCVIRYSTENMSVDLRIGGKDNETFYQPCHISSDEKYIYVCCEPNKVRRIDRKSFVVSDYAEFKTNVLKFYKFHNNVIISTNNGCYLINENEQQ